MQKLEQNQLQNHYMYIFSFYTRVVFKALYKVNLIVRAVKELIAINNN